MKHDIPRLRRNFCRAMRRGGKIVYVNLEDLAELLTVYAEREIERSLQGQPLPPISERKSNVVRLPNYTTEGTRSARGAD